MSFTTDVKKELLGHYTKSAHCRIAELAASVAFSKGRAAMVRDGVFRLVTDSEEVAKKCFTTISKTLNMKSVLLEEESKKTASGSRYKVIVEDDAEAKLLALKTGMADVKELEKITAKSCCKRAFLRAAFISAGSITDPDKNYHFEIKCDNEELAGVVRDMMAAFSLNARISKRRDKALVYIKEGPEVVEMLGIMEAHSSLMNYENARIVREMRGNVNRKVNCETANIGKTIGAAFKQIEDINYINETVGLSSLEPGLLEIARARLENPDMPLSALGDTLETSIGKSGVNHRLRKISAIAEDIRRTEGRKQTDV